MAKASKIPGTQFEKLWEFLIASRQYAIESKGQQKRRQAPLRPVVEGGRALRLCGRGGLEAATFTFPHRIRMLLFFLADQKERTHKRRPEIHCAPDRYPCLDIPYVCRSGKSGPASA